MCIQCGCGSSHKHAHEHHHDDHKDCVHDHHHHEEHHHDEENSSQGPLGASHEHGTKPSRAIQIEEDILSVNNRYAEENRDILIRHRVLALNLVSSPGSGKTTLLTATLAAKRFSAAVIEGDQSTEMDAERIRATGAPAVQINTGNECHLDAHRVGHAMEDLDIPKGSLDGGVLFVENIGNLICPAAFDLGEAAKVVLLSVTEGEEKPLKYPDMFAAARLMVVTKMDLLPYVSFSLDKCIEYARKINPKIEVITLSSTTGEGMDAWFDWIEQSRTL